MINNRQGGRRRGRGGQRNQNLGGNRQDNRQRGNAAQLLEKYKNMARDAQLAGDRVQSEYFLQFADHYFRVLGENRPRFEEQRSQRPEDSSEGEHEDEVMEAADEQSGDRSDRPERQERHERQARGNGRDRYERNGAPVRESEQDQDEGEDDERIAMEALPPAIGRDAGDEGEEVAAKPRRRARKPRNDADDADIAPAA